MSRKSHRNRLSSYTQRGRDTKVSIARRSLPLSDFNLIDKWRKDRLSPLTEVEDRRRFHPMREMRNPRTIVGTSSQIRPVSERAHASSAMTDVGFIDPARVLVCARRRMRREVLHARGIAGGTGFRSPRFNFWSNVSCKG